MHWEISKENKGLFGIAGHVGVGHVHSHSSFVQDDSAGFALVASLLRDLFQVDTRVKKVCGDPALGSITVETWGGGLGKSYANRGLTPMEVALLARAENEDGIFTQKLALQVFGRMYGQGVTETPVALQGAVALAVMDTLIRQAPDRFQVTTGKLPGRIDQMADIVVNFRGIPLSLLLTINGSDGGIGPDEDYEGNTAWGEKGAVMEKVGMTRIPTIVVESKAYVPSIQDIKNPTFLFRAEQEIDNMSVAESLVYAAQKLNIPHLLVTDSLPQVKGQLAGATAAFADRLIDLANSLKTVDSAADKVQIIAQLAKLISEDAGGVSFMSNSIQEKVRSAGMVPGTSAVISLLVPQAYRDYWKIPMIDEHDLMQYRQIILEAILHLAESKEKAYRELAEKYQG